MKKLLALLTIALLPMTATAHGPSGLKVIETVTIKAEPTKIWTMVKDFGGIDKWHPSIASTKVEQKKDAEGVDSTYRLLTLKDGGTIYEKLGSIDEADMKIKYYIETGVLPVNDYYATMGVKAGPGAGETTVTWTARFYRKYKLNPPIPPGEDDESAIKAVTNVLKTGLENLKKVSEGK